MSAGFNGPPVKNQNTTFAAAPLPSSWFKKIVEVLVTLGAVGASLYLVWVIYASGQLIWALFSLCLLGCAFYIYLSKRTYTYRYLFPGLAGIAIFIVFPLLYTIQISFTNYSSSNLLSFERSTQYLLEQTYPLSNNSWNFTLYPDGQEFRILLQQKTELSESNNPANAKQLEQTLISPSLALLSPTPPPEIKVTPFKEASFQPTNPAPISEVIKHRDILAKLKLTLPDGSQIGYSGLREFSAQKKTYQKNPDGSLTNTKTGQRLTPNFTTGFYQTAEGEPIKPGFTVGIGWQNYLYMLSDQDFRGPFLAIFLWTVAFALLTVVFTTSLGCTLAVLLNWEALRFRVIYRTLLFLPYAVPGFISILVFKGLFNGNFGEINLILNALFGIKPQWFADPWLAKTMILIVNTWLGYPYVMVLCTGLIKTIPSDLYEASAIAGAGPLTNFFKITFPLIVKPLTPLLIASFAFNFNNFVLIALLTGGRPDFLNTKVPAGTTDILSSYTYRIAFQDSGQNFGLAAAIATVIFLLVALLSILNLKLTRVNQQER